MKIKTRRNAPNAQTHTRPTLPRNLLNLHFLLRKYDKSPTSSDREKSRSVPGREDPILSDTLSFQF